MKKCFTLLLIAIYGCCFGQEGKNTKIFDTLCDSIYKNKGYKIIQHYFPDGIDSINNKNTVFQLLLTKSNKKTIIYQDTIYSSTGEIVFRDFNNDGIKDILMQNISDVRSNWTYYLYLVDTVRDRLEKINGFEEIKNPNYLPKYNLIDNYVNSGQNWTNFYKIKGNKIKDFGIVIYDGQTDAENEKYIQAHKKAIQTILKNEKTSP
jgi:hypothetical protein